MSSLRQTIEENSVRKIPEDLKGLVSSKVENKMKPEIHRIKTAAAFRKLGGGEDLPLDFNVRDLVIVYGRLGCSRGNVMFSLQDSTVHFSIDLVQHCTHMTCQLCLLIPYTASYGILKDLVIAPAVNIGKPGLKGGWGLAPQKLADTNATRVGLSACELTDKDLEKLKDFKKLTHLYLSYNRITDKGLVHLSHMKKLKQLYLADNRGITDAWLGHLRPVMASRIQMLSVSGTAVRSRA
jgi:hypothetical protein